MGAAIKTAKRKNAPRNEAATDASAAEHLIKIEAVSVSIFSHWLNRLCNALHVGKAGSQINRRNSKGKEA